MLRLIFKILAVIVMTVLLMHFAQACAEKRQISEIDHKTLDSIDQHLEELGKISVQINSVIPSYHYKVYKSPSGDELMCDVEYGICWVVDGKTGEVKLLCKQ